MELNKIYQGDCLEVIKNFSDRSINCIWIDPPYNIGYGYDIYKDKREDYIDWVEKWLRESYRLLKMDASIFIKISSKYFYEYMKILEKIGFYKKNVIIWKRKSQANYKDKFLGGYEVILFYSKTGDNKFFPEGVLRDTQFLKRWDGTKEYKGRLNDLWDDIRPVTAGNLIHPEGIYIKGTGKKEHPAQHPEELVDRSILCSTQKGDVVLDFFCGSGTVLASAVKNKRKYIGVDLSKNYCDICEERIEKIVYD